MFRGGGVPVPVSAASSSPFTSLLLASGAPGSQLCSDHAASLWPLQWHLGSNREQTSPPSPRNISLPSICGSHLCLCLPSLSLAQDFRGISLFSFPGDQGPSCTLFPEPLPGLQEHSGSGWRRLVCWFLSLCSTPGLHRSSPLQAPAFLSGSWISSAGPKPEPFPSPAFLCPLGLTGPMPAPAL